MSPPLASYEVIKKHCYVEFQNVQILVQAT